MNTHLVPALAHSATGHGSAELVVQHILPGLRRRRAFPASRLTCAEIAHEWNMQIKATTGMSPYMLQFGRPTTLAQRMADATRLTTGNSLPDRPDAAVVAELMELATVVRSLGASRRRSSLTRARRVD